MSGATPPRGPSDDGRETEELPTTSADAGPDPGAARAARSVDDLAALLRETAETAPPSVTDRALGRVRVESTALALVRTLFGAWARVAAAVPDLLGAPPRPSRAPTLLADDAEDTGELPVQRPDPD